MTEKRMAYFINPLARAKDGGYIPCIAVEDEAGYYRTDWNWGTNLTLAEQLADERNAHMDISPADAWMIVASSMRPETIVYVEV